MKNSLIFFPLKYPEGNWRPHGLAFEEANFEADGLKLHGWYVEAAEPRAVVLVAHGNGGNVTHRVDLMKHFQALGASTLVFDYRGYGRSEGSPSEAGVLADARAARRWLAERAGIPEKRDRPVRRIAGRRRQVDLAASDGARGLILLNTFDSIAGVAAYHYPWIPVQTVDADAAGFAGQDRRPITVPCCKSTARPTRSCLWPWPSDCSTPPASRRSWS